MYYVYILKQKEKEHFYVGYTNDLQRRIKEHFDNETKSTQGRKWFLKCYFAFRSEQTAKDFEEYLKSGSGRAFCKKHFAM